MTTSHAAMTTGDGGQTVLDLLQASPVGPVLDMPVPQTPMEALAASPLGPLLDTPFTDIAAGALPALPALPPLPTLPPLPVLPPLPGIDHLMQPITDLAAAFGTGTFATSDPTAQLLRSSSTIDTALSMTSAGLRAVADAWDGPAAAAAQAQGQQAQVAGAGLRERGTEISAVTRDAAATVSRGNAELAVVADSFVATAAAVAPVALTPPGQTALIAAAADHLQRALTVVAQTRAELAGHQTALTALATPIAVPAPPMPASGLAVGSGPSPITVAAALLDAVAHPYGDGAAREVPAQTVTAGVTSGTTVGAVVPHAAPVVATTHAAGSAGAVTVPGVAVGTGLGGVGRVSPAPGRSVVAPRPVGSPTVPPTAPAAPPVPHAAGTAGSPHATPGTPAPAGMAAPACRPAYDDSVDRTAAGYLVAAAPVDSVVGELPLVAPAVIGGTDPDDLGID